MHAKGVIDGKYDKKQGRWWYTQSDIDAGREYLEHIPKRSRSEQTARAIEHFKKSSDDIDIMLDLRITRDRLEQLRADIYPGGLHFDRDTVREMRAALEGSGLAARSSRDILESVRLLCVRDRELSRRELSEPA